MSKEYTTDNIYIDGYLSDGSGSGTSGQVLSSTGGGVSWVDGSGTIIGGPYLPLSAGSSYPLTGDLYQTLGTIGVAQADGDYIAKIYELNSDGFLSLYTGQPTPLERIHISSYGNSWFNAVGANVGIGTTGPTRKLHIVSGATNALSLDSTEQYMMEFAKGGVSKYWFKVTSNDSFQLHKNGTGDFITVLSSGNIGIGVTGPTDKLQVVGTIRADGRLKSIQSSSSTNLATNNGGALTLFNSSATDGNFSNIGGYNSNNLVTSQINFINISQTGRTGAITFHTHNGGSLPERMRIDSA
jgi:hypothetical protein